MKNLCISLAVCVGSMAASEAVARHVDFLDAGPFDITALAGGTNQGTQTVVTGDSGALGGERRVTLSSIGASSNALLTVDDPDILDDGVEITSDPGGTANILFEYGLTSNMNADFLNIPGMPGRRWNSIEVQFGIDGTDIGGNGLSVTLTSDQGGPNQQTAMASIPSGTLATGSLFLPHSDFRADNPGIDFTDIDRASLALDGVTDGSYELLFFARAGNVPEPSTCVLAAMVGVFGLAVVRRKRS